MTRILRYTLGLLLLLPTLALGMNLDAGCYEGTGSAKTITMRDNFSPGIIVVKRKDTAVHPRIWLSNMSGFDCRFGANCHTGGTGECTTCITGASSGSFTLGTSSDVNNSGSTYCWWAAEANASYLKIGSYTGNGGTQGVTGVGFQPEAVVSFGHDATNGATRGRFLTNSFDGEDYENVGTTYINSFDADGFTVPNNGLNDSGVTYYYMAFNDNNTDVDVVSFTGNNTLRTISTACQPAIVLGAFDSSNASYAIGWDSFALPWGVSNRMTNTAGGGGFQSLGVVNETNGFTVLGQDQGNKTGVGYQVVVLCDTIPRITFDSTGTKLYMHQERGYAEGYSAQGVWSTTAASKDYSMDKVKYEVESGNQAVTVTGTPMLRRFTSLPLDSGQQYIGGTVQMAIPVKEDDATSDTVFRIHIYIAADGGAVQRTLLDKYVDTTEWDSSAKVAQGLTSQPITLNSGAYPYTAVAGDRLVVEFGDKVTGTSGSGAIAYGGTGGTDYTVSDAYSSSKVAWIKFSMDPPPTSTPTGTLTFTVTPTSTPTPTITNTPTRTPTNTSTPVPTATGSGCPATGIILQAPCGNAAEAGNPAGTIVWNNEPAMCDTFGNTPAYTQFTPAGGTSEYLDVTGFWDGTEMAAHGISPSDPVYGVTIDFLHGTLADVTDQTIKLKYAGGLVAPVNKADPATWCNTGQNCDWVTYGGMLDTWGVTLQAQDIFTVNSGVRIAATVTAGWPGPLSIVYVDECLMTVCVYAPTPSPTPTSTLTPTFTKTNTPQPTSTPTQTKTPTVVPSFTRTRTITATRTPIVGVPAPGQCKTFAPDSLGSFATRTPTPTP